MRSRLPLFPLGTVLFPGLVLPLHIFEERYRLLVRHLTEVPADRPREFGVVAIRRGWEVESTPGRPEGGSPASVTLYEIGCVARVRRITELPDGRFDLLAVGGRRFRIIDVDRSLPYLTAEVEWLPEPSAPTGAVGALAGQVRELFGAYLASLGAGPGTEHLPDEPTTLSYAVAAAAALTVADRQALLAAADVPSRLHAERRLLHRELALLRRVRAVPAPLKDFAVAPSLN